MGATPSQTLIHGVTHGDVDAVRSAVAKGADVNHRPGDHTKHLTPLALAARGGHYDVVQYLLDQNALDRPGGKKRFTALHEACAYNQERVAQLLLERGANPWVQDVRASRDTKTAATRIAFTGYDAARRKGHTGLVRMMEQHMFPFRDRIEVHSRSMGIFGKHTPYYVVIARPMPGAAAEDAAATADIEGARTRPPRCFARLLFYKSQRQAQASFEVDVDSVGCVGRTARGASFRDESVSFQLSPRVAGGMGGAQPLRLRCAGPTLQWFMHVLSDAYAPGSGNVFDVTIDSPASGIGGRVASAAAAAAGAAVAAASAAAPAVVPGAVPEKDEEAPGAALPGAIAVVPDMAPPSYEAAAAYAAGAGGAAAGAGAAEAVPPPMAAGASADDDAVKGVEFLAAGASVIEAIPSPGLLTVDLPAAVVDDAPDAFVCPISFDIMRDPVVAADGRSYERQSIVEWLSAGNDTSPITNEPLPFNGRIPLLPNWNLRSQISEWVSDRKRSVEHERKATRAEAARAVVAAASAQAAADKASEAAQAAEVVAASAPAVPVASPSRSTADVVIAYPVVAPAGAPPSPAVAAPPANDATHVRAVSSDSARASGKVSPQIAALPSMQDAEASGPASAGAGAIAAAGAGASASATAGVASAAATHAIAVRQRVEGGGADESKTSEGAAPRSPTRVAPAAPSAATATAATAAAPAAPPAASAMGAFPGFYDLPSPPTHAAGDAAAATESFEPVTEDLMDAILRESVSSAQLEQQRRDLRQQLTGSLAAGEATITTAGGDRPQPAATLGHAPPVYTDADLAF